MSQLLTFLVDAVVGCFASFASKSPPRKKRVVSALRELFSLTKWVPYGDLARARDRSRDEILE